MSVPELARLLTGGQTGADLGALRAGKALGIPTGGLMPRGFRNELGRRPWMKEMFGMTEHPNYDYGPRTIANVKLADALVCFGDLRSPGSKKTMDMGAFRGIPCEQNPSSTDLADWVARIYHARGEVPFVLMVAGNRESTNRGIEAVTFHRIIRAWNTEMAAPLPAWDVRLHCWMRRSE